jgi:hypothetical protein
MVNGRNTNELLQAMASASLVIKALSAQGIAIKGVTLTKSRPVIRVERCGWCDGLIDNGRAAYLEFGCGAAGRYRQGHFYTGGCKVVWSESLH